ncbi:MAG: tetratricopeptide repeat protein [Armatimonadota bacterium]
MSLRGVVVGGFLLAAMGAALAQAEGGPLAEANRLYARGEFTAAAGAYREALQAGYDGARVHYNLANALHRSGRLGEAIAHYLAARRMAPRDPDIRANLQQALRQRPLGPPAPPPSWLHALWTTATGRLTLNELAGAAAACYWLAMAGLAALLLGLGPRRRMMRAAIVLGALALIATTLGVGRWWREHRTAEGVVVAETAELRTGPGESFESVQTLSEGWTLQVREREGDWWRVTAEGGSSGWLRAAAATSAETGASGEPGSGTG